MTTLEERIAVVETELKNTREQMGSMSAKVDDMHSIVQAFKGVKWAVLALAGIAGFIAGKLGGLIALFSGKV